MTKKTLRRADEIVKETELLSDTYASVRKHGLINLGDKIDKFNKKISKFRARLSGDQRTEISDHLTSTAQSQFTDQIRYGIIGALGGGLGAKLTQIVSQYDSDQLIAACTVFGAIVGASAVKKIGYGALAAVKKYINSNQSDTVFDWFVS